MEPQLWPSSFPALQQRVNEHPLSFLDSAATTLRPQSVIDALVDYYSTDNANPSRVHTLASRAANRLSAARQTLARFVNATDLVGGFQAWRAAGLAVQPISSG